MQLLMKTEWDDSGVMRDDHRSVFQERIYQFGSRFIKILFRTTRDHNFQNAFWVRLWSRDKEKWKVILGEGGGTGWTGDKDLNEFSEELIKLTIRLVDG